MRKTITTSRNAFSLLEVVVVLSVLGLLSSIAIPNVIGLAKTNKIDSARSKINSAAVYCLQAIREGVNLKDPIPESVISSDLLTSDEYEVRNNENTCESLWLDSSKDDPFFFPMGFSISPSGELTKLAIPTSEKSERSCKAWAGANCNASEEFLALIAHNKAVQEAKIQCNDAFYTWLNGSPPNVLPGDGKRNRWDSNADSACRSSVPANTGLTCTTDGCKSETWAFEGTIVNGEDGYDAALERKYGRICKEELEKIRQQETTGGPVSILECGASRQMWFFKGVD